MFSNARKIISYWAIITRKKDIETILVTIIKYPQNAAIIYSKAKNKK